MAVGSTRSARRGALIVLSVLMIVGTVGAHGFAHADNNIGAFLPVLGFGGANVTVFTVWLPAQYPTSVRATIFVFVTTVTAGSLALPLAGTAIPFVVDIALSFFTTETKGQSLPA